jgi:aspartate 1-decarboxylase
VFELNGGGARLGEIGDPCVVLSYKLSSHFEGASVIFCDKYNKLTKFIKY